MQKLFACFKQPSSLNELVTEDPPDWNRIQRFIIRSKNKNNLFKQPIDNDGRYLLHHACWKNAPSELVIQLIHDYPKACNEKDNTGWYALHYSCACNQSESVIEILITKYPKVCQEKTNIDGWYALHLACCCKNKSELIIQLLITAYPEACQITNKDGLLPLHHACARNASLAVIQLLVQQYPNALTAMDNDDKTPLDWAWKPHDNKISNKETTTWLENYIPNTKNETPKDTTKNEIYK